jgi:hypothetical protein
MLEANGVHALTRGKALQASAKNRPGLRGVRALSAAGTECAYKPAARTASGTKETRMFKGLKTQRLLALFFAGGLLFNFPLLALWDRDVTLWGVPLFPAALFIVWGVLIALLALIVERGDDADDAAAGPR